MGAIGFVKRTPCALLLVAQVVGVLLYPFMESSSGIVYIAMVVTRLVGPQAVRKRA